MTIRERDIQGKVVGYARGLGVLARKLDFGQGWPDYMFLFNGQILFIEFKRPGERPEPLQLHVHKLLEAQGFIVEVTHSSEFGIALIDELVGQPKPSVVSYSDITKALVASKNL